MFKWQEEEEEEEEEEEKEEFNFWSECLWVVVVKLVPILLLKQQTGNGKEKQNLKCQFLLYAFKLRAKGKFCKLFM